MKGNLIEMAPPDDEFEEVFVGGLPGTNFSLAHGAEKLLELTWGGDKLVIAGQPLY
jgi:hypothetical protein